MPFAVHEWDQFFETLEGEVRDGVTVLDFSEPALHRYRKHGVSLYAPSLAEDDSMDAYTACVSSPGRAMWCGMLARTRG